MAYILWLVTGCSGIGDEAPDAVRRVNDVPAHGDALLAGCGDGILDPGEECDDGNISDHDGCSAACTLELVTQFSFTGALGTEITFAADVVDPELAATPAMSRGAGLTPSAAANAFSASAWTTSVAIDPDDFYSFTVAPAAGTAMKLVGLQLDERRSATGIRSGSVRSSLDGFASDVLLFAVPDDILTRTQTVSLPTQFHNLTTAVEFRIFGFQAEAASGTWRVDNVKLIGDVAPTCGNGTPDPGEECDDGNISDHDGCSAACTLELVTRFSFTGALGTEVAFAADVADPELATTPVMSRGAGLTPSVAADAFSASAWTTSVAPDPSDFYSFTVTPVPGATMQLVGLQLDERRSATGIRSGSVRSSLDGFASDILLFAVPDDILFRTQTLPLPAQFRDLTTAVEFRIFGFQAEAAGGTWRIDNVLLLGEIEPACGNGNLDPGEQCDDGNTTSTDGCSAACTLELVTKLSFTGAAGTEVTFAADTVDPALATTPVMSRGAGLTPSAAVDAFSAAAWTSSVDLDPDDFYSFTVTPVAGATMKLVGLQLDERRSATGIRSGSVRSSLDGFASDILLFAVPDDTLFRTQTVALPTQFHNLTTAVEFRIFGFQAEAAGGTWRVDNVTLLGTLSGP
jgi:cysteine-rich repeat protein